MTRSIHAYVLSLASVYCFGALACSSSNDPSTSGTAGAAAATAGATGTGTPPVGGAPGTAGASGTAGAPAAGGGDGTAGAPAAGTAGAGTGTAGAGTGTAGAGGTGTTYTPLCAGLTTAASVAPTKGGACTAADPQLCYKPCGPQGVGFKSETCTAAAYAEQSGCSFPPDADYSCFKVPTTQSATCPAMTPMSGAPCTVAACTPCADAMGKYFDSTNPTAKPGYCVCPASTTGTSKWSCASTTSWPCPMGKGC